jgi:P27 family predicted phage terminase small subunit
MAKGRKKLPTKIKIAKGTFQKCREIQHVEFPVIAEIPPPPKELDGVGEEIYFTITKWLQDRRILQEVGMPSIVSYCFLISRHLKAERMLREEGDVIEGKDGPKQNPWHRISIDAQAAANRIAPEFGLTPSSQTKILNSLSNLADKTDEFFD